MCFVIEVLFHRHFTNSVLPKLYGKEWNENSVRVMRERQIKEIR